MRINFKQLAFPVLLVGSLMISSCGPASTPTPDPTATAEPSPTPKPASISLTSPAFEAGGMIPSKYTRRGDDISLPLAWGNPPAGTVCFALIFYSDPMPDGGGNWVQWILYNIPAEARSLEEDVSPDSGGMLPDGSQAFANSWGELKYGGPNPQHVEMRSYFLELYALDAFLDLDAVEDAMEADGSLPWIGSSKAVFMRAIEGHVLAVGELWGRYKEPAD